MDATRIRINLETEGDDFIEQLGILGRPDLLIVSPNYRITPGSVRDDENVSEVTEWLNDLMMKFDCAIASEGHWIKPQQGHQSITPEGSAVWGHWATFVVALHKDGRLSFPNGDRFRHQREWPSALREGDPTSGEWPWMAAREPREERFFYLASIARTLPANDRSNRRKIEQAVNQDLSRRGIARDAQLAAWGYKPQGSRGNPLGENAIRAVITDDARRWQMAVKVAEDATQLTSNDQDDTE